MIEEPCELCGKLAPNNQPCNKCGKVICNECAKTEGEDRYCPACFNKIRSLFKLA